MIRHVAFFLLVALCSTCVSAAPKKNAKSDLAAIRKSVTSYVTAFNRGDAKAVAAHWSDEGEWISPSGRRFQGRKAIEAEMQSYFAESENKPQIEVINPKVRLLAATVGIEEGKARVIRAGELPVETSYIAIHVKQNGQWKLDSVRETNIPAAPSNYQHLKDLDWMVGTWIDADENGSIETTCEWTKNKNFLMRTFTAKIKDRIEMQGTQIIGWDASQKRIRTWIFDSQGGFGEGIWTRDGNRWIVKAAHVMQSGEKASSVNIITYVDNNKFTWESVGREIDGQLMPNIDPVTVVRK